MTAMLCFAMPLSDGVESNHPNPIHPPAHSCLNNEVTSPSWLQPRSKKSIVSITMTKNEDPMLQRWMWCPCPANSPNPKPIPHPHLPITHTLRPHSWQPITQCHSVNHSEGKWNLQCRLNFPFVCCSGLCGYCLMLKHKWVIHPCTHSIQVQV